MTCCESSINTRLADVDEARYPEWLIAASIFVIVVIGLSVLGLLAILQPSIILVAAGGVAVATLFGTACLRLLSWGDTYSNRRVTWAVLSAVVMVMDLVVTAATIFGRVMAGS